MVPPSTSVPRVTYGKKRPALLPLTAEQFRRSSIFEIPTEDNDVVAQVADLDQDAQQGANSAPSQLSDAEPSEEVSSTPDEQTVTAGNNASALSEPGSTRCKQPARTSGYHGMQTATLDTASAVLQHHDAPTRRPKRRHPSPQSRDQPAVLPNELLLVPMQFVEDLNTGPPVESNEASPSRLRDDLATQNGRVVEVVHGPGNADHTPAKAIPKNGLTAHRKRLKTAVREHKSIRNLHRKRSAHDNRTLPGDGFEKSELNVTHRHRLKLRHRRQRKARPLWEGFQELTLCAEPADQPDFLRSPIRNEPPPGQPAALPLSAHGPGDKSSRFNGGDPMPGYERITELPAAGPPVMTRQQELVAMELSSLSAPVRQYSVSVCSDEDDDEAEVDDGAAGSYVDHIDVDTGAADEIIEFESGQEDEDDSAAEDEAGAAPEQIYDNGIVTRDFRRSSQRDRPGLMRRPSGRHLMEVDETIFDEPDPEPDQEILLDDAPAVIPPVAALDLPRPRSILKSSTVTPAPVNAGPELTARNTRHNSRIPTTYSSHFSSPPPSSDPDSEPMLDEESRYFTLAQQQLASAPAEPRSIIRKTSNNPSVGYAYADAMEVQAPYSGEVVVAETSSVRERFADASQLHVLKRSGDVAWHAERQTSQGERNLSRLTRRVSMEHGTLSQGVRRRRSVVFDAGVQ